MAQRVVGMAKVNGSRKEEEESFEKRVGEGGFPRAKRELSALPK